MTKKKYIIPIFIPHMGCMNDCIFCNQRKITKINSAVEPGFIKEEIEKYLKYFPENATDIELAFYGGSFTGLGTNTMISYLSAVKPLIERKMISSIRLSTRPDYIDEFRLEILKQHNVETIELGVQSMVDSVLEFNKRGTSSSDVVRAVDLIKRYKFKLGLQMMTGMAGSSKENDIYTAEKIISLNPDFVRIYPTMVIENTELKHLYDSGKYKPMELDELIIHLKDIVSLFEENKINIIRIGLPEDGDFEDTDFIGPSHPSLRQIVYGDLFLDAIKKELDKLDIKNKLTLYSNNSELSYLVGYAAKNKKYLKSIFTSEISFKTDNLNDGCFILEQDDNIIKIDMSNFYKNRNKEVGIETK